MLCLHGFSGTPYEVRPLGRALGERGMTVLGPVLAGHGQDARALAASTAQDWLASAEAALLALRQRTGAARLGVLGFSMGGLLALRLAARHPDLVSVLVLLSVPLRLRRYQRVGIRALGCLPGPLRRALFLPKLGGPDVTDPGSRADNPGLPVMPVAALRELLRLQAHARADLPRVRVPTLVAHGLRDRTVPHTDALELLACLGEQAEPLWLPRSGHLLGVDVERELLATAVVRFFEARLPPA